MLVSRSIPEAQIRACLTNQTGCANILAAGSSRLLHARWTSAIVVYHSRSNLALPQGLGFRDEDRVHEVEKALSVSRRVGGRYTVCVVAFGHLERVLHLFLHGVRLQHVNDTAVVSEWRGWVGEGGWFPAGTHGGDARTVAELMTTALVMAAGPNGAVLCPWLAVAPPPPPLPPPNVQLVHVLPRLAHPSHPTLLLLEYRDALPRGPRPEVDRRELLPPLLLGSDHDAFARGLGLQGRVEWGSDGRKNEPRLALLESEEHGNCDRSDVDFEWQRSSPESTGFAVF